MALCHCEIGYDCTDTVKGQVMSESEGEGDGDGADDALCLLCSFNIESIPLSVCSFK